MSILLFLVKFHMKCGTYMFLILLKWEVAAAITKRRRIQIVCSNHCAGSSLLIFTKIPMIFCRHSSGGPGLHCKIFGLIAQGCVRWWPFWIKKTLLHFYPNLFCLFQWKLSRTLLGLRGTLSRNMTSNDLKLGKWQPF